MSTNQNAYSSAKWQICNSQSSKFVNQIDCKGWLRLRLQSILSYKFATLGVANLPLSSAIRISIGWNVLLHNSNYSGSWKFGLLSVAFLHLCRSRCKNATLRDANMQQRSVQLHFCIAQNDKNVIPRAAKLHLTRGFNQKNSFTRSFLGKEG